MSSIYDAASLGRGAEVSEFLVVQQHLADRLRHFDAFDVVFVDLSYASLPNGDARIKKKFKIQT